MLFYLIYILEAFIMNQEIRNIEEIIKESREAGLSEDFIQWTIENLDLLEKLSDDNFEEISSDNTKQDT